jgi:hypothetical protein
MQKVEIVYKLGTDTQLYGRGGVWDNVMEVRTKEGRLDEEDSNAV